MIKIDKNIKVPAPRTKSRKYPFKEMAVGDSFFVEGNKNTNITGTVSYATRKTGFRFTSRTVENGVRVWRIA